MNKCTIILLWLLIGTLFSFSNAISRHKGFKDLGRIVGKIMENKEKSVSDKKEDYGFCALTGKNTCPIVNGYDIYLQLNTYCEHHENYFLPPPVPPHYTYILCAIIAIIFLPLFYQKCFV